MHGLSNTEKLINNLPEESKNIKFDAETGILSWVMPNDNLRGPNKNSVLFLNTFTGEAYWEGNYPLELGYYYYTIENLKDFKQSLIDWKEDFKLWND